MPKKKSNKKKKRAQKEKERRLAYGAAPLSGAQEMSPSPARQQATWGSTRDSAQNESGLQRQRLAKSTEKIFRRVYRSVPDIASKVCSVVSQWNEADQESQQLLTSIKGLVDRLASIQNISSTKSRVDVLSLFSGIDVRLRQRHVEDLEDSLHNLRIILGNFNNLMDELGSCLRQARQLMSMVVSETEAQPDNDLLFNVAFSVPRLDRPVPIEALVRCTENLVLEFTRDYWHKHDLVSCLRYTEPELVDTIVTKWTASDSFNSVLVDAHVLQLQSCYSS